LCSHVAKSASHLTGKKVKRRPGFTLIELLVAIAVLAILAAFLLPALPCATARHRSSPALAGDPMRSEADRQGDTENPMRRHENGAEAFPAGVIQADPAQDQPGKTQFHEE